MSFEQYCTPPPTRSVAPRRPPLRVSPSYTPVARQAPSRSFSLPASPSTPRARLTPSANTEDRERDSEKADMEVYMGALVSPSPGNEKRSIDVPCIILTEPDILAHPRLPSPPPKQIVLLPSTSLPLPLHASPAETNRGKWSSLVKSAVVCVALGLGAWHVWTVLGQFDAEHGYGQYRQHP